MEENNIFIFTEEGENIYPGTLTDAIMHTQSKKKLTLLLEEYNLDVLWPLGEGEKYTLLTAITALVDNLEDSVKVPGVKAKFIGSNGNLQVWEYFSSNFSFDNENGWREVDSGVIQELQESVFPVTISLNCSSTLEYTKTETTLNFTWEISRRGRNVTTASRVLFGRTGSLVDVSGTTGKTITTTENLYSTETYMVTGTYEGIYNSKSLSVVFVDPCYRGIVGSSWIPSAEDIKATTKLKQGSRNSTWSGINLDASSPTSGRVFYAYPKYFSTLSSIKDANSFEYINSYTRTELNIDGVDYYVYTLTEPTTISGFKQIYS